MFLSPCNQLWDLMLPSQRYSLYGLDASVQLANVARMKSASTASTLIRRFFTRPGIRQRISWHLPPPTTFISFRVETNHKGIRLTLRLADRVAGYSSCQFHWCFLPDIASDMKCLLYVKYCTGQQLSYVWRLMFFLCCRVYAFACCNVRHVCTVYISKLCCCLNSDIS